MNSRFIISFQNGNNLPNAVAKAPGDISEFLGEAGYTRIEVSTMGDGTSNVPAYFCRGIWRVVSAIPRGSTAVVQYPVYSKKGTVVLSCARFLLRTFKSVRFLAVIHDIRCLQMNGRPDRKEIRELNRYDALVVHSGRMAEFLEENGCRRPRVELGLFDYSVRKGNTLTRTLSSDICFAGNLAKKTFLNHLEELCSGGLTFSLYGAPPIESSSAIRYCGVFSGDDVSDIKGSWGLVWDGESTDGLVGTAGEYQKFNSPHKASLYIAAGLPLVVNSEAAIAPIVRENGLGICIDSLSGLHSVISEMTEEEYGRILSNVKSYSRRLMSGADIVGALDRIL